MCTYADLYGEIRRLFASCAASRAAGPAPGAFSFNTPGGRCETCEGLGCVKSSLLLFDDIDVTCPDCGGRRFQDEPLPVHWQGRNIRDVLSLPVEEALEVFAGQRSPARKLALLRDVGRGHLELGQTLTPLSGGEGQRLKLARELIESGTKPALYLMDGPPPASIPGTRGISLRSWTGWWTRAAPW